MAVLQQDIEVTIAGLANGKPAVLDRVATIKRYLFTDVVSYADNLITESVTVSLSRKEC